MAKSDSKSTPPRQITLPLKVALRIAYENIRLRLTRSLLATSGIVLGVAFLTSILVMNLTVRGMREWMADTISTRRDVSDRDQLNSAIRLGTMMKTNGVPVTPAEISADRIQTRWLLGLGLLVAFIGILNSMLMSVTERFREIGTMKCLGALDGFIVRLFLLESLFQGLVGTTLGILVGVALGLAAQTITYGHFAWKNVLVGDLAGSLAVCFLVGLALTVAGAIYPAWKAARMQPIAAMRVEP